MKKVIIIFFILLINQCYSQEIPLKDSPIQSSLLRAISIQNDFLSNNYYYGETKLDSPFALQIPFKDLNDREVLKGYETYKKTYRYSGYIYSISSIILLSNTKTITSSSKIFFLTFGGAYVAEFIIKGIGRNKLKKAINRYNSLIIR